MARGTRVLLGLLGAGAAAALAPTVWVYGASMGHRYRLSDAPRHPVAIVLGAAVWGTEPSPMLARRLDLAALLYAAEKVDSVLVTGDNSAFSRHETDVMARYLRAAGVPEARIEVDPDGLRTWDSCVRARDRFGVRSALVVTQAFHLPRAVALCRAAGIDADGVGDPRTGVRWRSTGYGYAREVVANVRAALDAGSHSRQAGP